MGCNLRVDLISFLGLAACLVSMLTCSSNSQLIMILLEAAGMYLEKYSHLHMCALSKTLASLVYTAQFTMSDIDIYGRLFLILSEYIYYIILFFFKVKQVFVT